MYGTEEFRGDALGQKLILGCDPDENRLVIDRASQVFFFDLNQGEITMVNPSPEKVLQLVQTAKEHSTTVLFSEYGELLSLVALSSELEGGTKSITWNRPSHVGTSGRVSLAYWLLSHGHKTEPMSLLGQEGTKAEYAHRGYAYFKAPNGPSPREQREAFIRLGNEMRRIIYDSDHDRTLPTFEKVEECISRLTDDEVLIILGKTDHLNDVMICAAVFSLEGWANLVGESGVTRLKVARVAKWNYVQPRLNVK